MKIDQSAKRKGALVSFAVTIVVIVLFCVGIGYGLYWFINSTGSCSAQYIRHTDGAVTETDCS